MREDEAERLLATAVAALLSARDVVSCVDTNAVSSDIDVHVPLGWRGPDSGTPPWRSVDGEFYCFGPEVWREARCRGLVEIDANGMPAITSETREAAQALVAAAVLAVGGDQ